jgi:hypothetical protein
MSAVPYYALELKDIVEPPQAARPPEGRRNQDNSFINGASFCSHTSGVIGPICL